MKKWIAALCVFVLLGFGALFVFREALDVVATGAESAFGAVLRVLPITDTDEGFSIESPDGSARIGWKRSRQSELYVLLDVRPFLDAGFLRDQSPYPIENGWMMISFGLTADLETPDLLIRGIAKQHREWISFHTAHGHYGLSLGGGNALEWAPNFEESEKDIVFVLSPSQLESAGVDIEKVEGWTYTTIPMMENGKTIEVYKLVKPYDLT